MLAATGEEALTEPRPRHPDLVLLDLGLPGIDGVDVIRGLRGWTSIPIIVLSARDGDASKVAALDAGADDYVTKPFGMNELLARLRATLRRHHPAPEEPVVETADFASTSVNRRVTARRGRVHLTPTEWGDRRAARAQPRPARHPAPAAAGRVGTAVRARDELPARPPRGDPPQARAGPGQPRYFITEPGMGYRFEPVLTRS